VSDRLLATGVLRRCVRPMLGKPDKHISLVKVELRHIYQLQSFSQFLSYSHKLLVVYVLRSLLTSVRVSAPQSTED